MQAIEQISLKLGTFIYTVNPIQAMYAIQCVYMDTLHINITTYVLGYTVLIYSV